MSEEHPPLVPRAAARRRVYAKLAVMVGLIAAAVWAAALVGLLDVESLAILVASVRDLRDIPGFIVLFLLVFTVAAAFGVPGSILMIAGGAIFGVTLGALLNWIGATLGAIGAYITARSLGRPTVQLLLGRRAAGIERYSAARGFVTLLWLRLLPVIPYNALNYGAALAGVRARDYIAATFLGILPIVLIYTALADAIVAGLEGARSRAALHAAAAGGTLITISLIPLAVRRLRARRKRRRQSR